MKFKKMISLVLVLAIIAMAGVPAYAKPIKVKGGMAPGLLKNMLLKSNISEEEAVELIIENSGSLSPGILKEIIQGLNLSADSLEELAEEGLLNGLPGGILKNIYSGDSDDDDDEDDDNDEIEVKGTITDIDIDDKIIEIDDKQYSLPSEVEVEIDDKEADLEDLKVGMLVELEIEDDEAEIEAKSVEEVITVEGTIEDLDLIGIYHITVDEKEYKIADEVDVTLNNEEATLQDLEVGMEVKIELIDDEVVKIYAQNIGYEVVEGTIEDLDLIGIYHITIDDEEYKIAEEVVVILDEEEATLQDLEVGMEARIKVSEDQVVKIYAQKIGTVEVEGTIEDLDLIGIYHITVDEKEYKIAEEVDVTLNNEEATLQDLEVGMEVKIELIDDEVVKIYAQNIGFDVVEGTIEDLDLIGIYHITIGETEYKISEEVDVTLDNEEATLLDLVVGMEAKIELIDEEVIKVYAQSMRQEVEGIIEDLDLIGTYHITIDETEYVLSREAQVVINSLVSSFEDLEIGMSVVVEIQEEIVVKVNVEFKIEEIEGKITGLDIEDRYIVIDEVEYKLADEVEIRLNNDEAILQDLEIEMQVNVVELNGDIVEINAFKEEVLEAQGEITAIDLDDGYITINGVEYQLSTEAIVKVDGEEAALQDLIVGMHAEAELNEEVIVKIYAVIIDSNKIEGIITDLDIIGIYHLTIDTVEYDLLNNAIVTLNNEEAKLEDLEVGMSAIIYLVENNIVKIQATKVVKERILGEIKDIDLIGDYYIKINDYEYALSREAQVTIDEQEATLQNLEVGMEAYLHVENDLVIKIDAQTTEDIIIKGSLTFINIDERNIQVDDVLYNLSDEIIVNIDEVEATLTELEAGMDIELQIDNGLVTVINASSIDQVEVLEVEGHLMAIDLEAKTITVDEEQYNLADSIEVITVNGVDSSLQDLEVNMSIEAELQDNKITKIAANDSVEQVSGEIIEMSITTSGIKLTIEIADDETVQYYVSNDLESDNPEALIPGNTAQFKVVNGVIVEAVIG